MMLRGKDPHVFHLRGMKGSSTSSPFRHDVKRPDAKRSSDIKTGCTEDSQYHLLAAHVVCPLNLCTLLRLAQAPLSTLKATHMT